MTHARNDMEEIFFKEQNKNWHAMTRKKLGHIIPWFLIYSKKKNFKKLITGLF